MMVIRGNIGTAAQGVPAGDGQIFPADRCVWVQQANPNGGYNIASAVYQAGGNAIEITDPVLGYIGKSGRFVEIAG